MGTATLILGESGTGKSASLRNFNPDDVLLIQVVKKPLPFKSSNWQQFTNENKQGSLISTDEWGVILKVINHSIAWGKKIIIIDDFQYVMSNEFMRRSEEKSFDKFTEIGRHTWEIIRAAQNAPDDLRIYFLCHTEETATGKIKMKTIGKMLDEKITVEGMFSIVLRTLSRDGQYLFSTINNGMDTVKSPMGMFSANEVENDLTLVDSIICDYYGLTQKEE